MPPRLSSFVLVLATTFLFAFVQAECYFPDKSLDADGYPCNTTVGAVTHCCRTFEACLDKGVCYTQWDSQIYRRSCTDENWSDGCPTVCTDGKFIQPTMFLCCPIPRPFNSCRHNVVLSSPIVFGFCIMLASAFLTIPL